MFARDPNVEQLERELDLRLARLLEESHGSRVTLRADDPQRGWECNLVCAEALMPGVKSLRGQGTIDQRAAATLQWMERSKEHLVQPDLTNDPDPAPPAALIGAYAVKAQMLTPLFNRAGFLQAWISVHYVDKPHEFTSEEIAALERARDDVRTMIGLDA